MCTGITHVEGIHALRNNGDALRAEIGEVGVLIWFINRLLRLAEFGFSEPIILVGIEQRDPVLPYGAE